MLPRVWIDIAYLIAAILFIIGLKGLTKPRTAVRGNLLGACGMLLAVLVTLLDKDVLTFGTILAGLIGGGAIGALFATRIRMESMPEILSINSCFALASARICLVKSVSSAPFDISGSGWFSTAESNRLSVFGSMPRPPIAC